MMLTEGMPNEARLLANGVEWQRSGGRLKPNGDRGCYRQSGSPPAEASQAKEAESENRQVALLFVSRLRRLACACVPAKSVSPWFYQVRPLDETKAHYGALPAHRLLFPSRPSCFRERTVPKRPACNPAYQRHGGGARDRCSFDTRVPLRHPRFCKQSRGRYWRGFASSAAHCVAESRLPGSWPCCIGSQSTPSGVQ